MNKKKIGFFKDELGGKIIKEFAGLRAKTYAYLMDDDSEKKKAKGTKKCVIKRILKFNDYEDGLFNNKIILKSQKRFKSDYLDLYTERISKIALSGYRVVIPGGARGAEAPTPSPPIILLS